MGKYNPITDYLANQNDKAIKLPFAEIEKIINRPLPPSAYEHNAWWANNPSHHSHARAWTNIGWRTQDVDMVGKSVKFIKDNSYKNNFSSNGQKLKKSIFGALIGTVKINDANFYEPLGIRWNAQDGEL